MPRGRPAGRLERIGHLARSRRWAARLGCGPDWWPTWRELEDALSSHPLTDPDLTMTSRARATHDAPEPDAPATQLTRVRLGAGLPSPLAGAAAFDSRRGRRG